jgi:hypothetical protein
MIVISSSFYTNIRRGVSDVDIERGKSKTYFLLRLGDSPPLNLSDPPGLKAYADDELDEDGIAGCM